MILIWAAGNCYQHTIFFGKAKAKIAGSVEKRE